MLKTIKAAYIIPKINGGKHRLANIKVLCIKCIDHKRNYDAFVKEGYDLDYIKLLLKNNGWNDLFKTFDIPEGLNDILNQNPIFKKQSYQVSTKRIKTKKETKLSILSSQNYKCGICAVDYDGNFDIDHIVPLSEGGSNCVANLMGLCIPCHKIKTHIEILKNNPEGLCEEDIEIIINKLHF